MMIRLGIGNLDYIVKNRTHSIFMLSNTYSTAIEHTKHNI